MTDPKALIERNARYLNPGDLVIGPNMLRNALEETDQALRDLTAENERLTEQRDFLGAQAADLALKVGRLQDRANVWKLKAEMAATENARLNALGDGLAGLFDEARVFVSAIEHYEGQSHTWRWEQALALRRRMDAALADWETR